MTLTRLVARSANKSVVATVVRLVANMLVKQNTRLVMAWAIVVGASSSEVFWQEEKVPTNLAAMGYRRIVGAAQRFFQRW